jgi:hypothetical protein
MAPVSSFEIAGFPDPAQRLAELDRKTLRQLGLLGRQAVPNVDV